MKTSDWAARRYWRRLADAERRARESEQHLAEIERMIATGDADDEILTALARRRSPGRTLSSTR
jgi:hypothetical protein